MLTLCWSGSSCVGFGVVVVWDCHLPKGIAYYMFFQVPLCQGEVFRIYVAVLFLAFVFVLLT